MTCIHILLTRKKSLARGVQQHDALDEIQRAEDEQVVLAVAALGHESIQRAGQAHGDVPLEALLQLEELPKGRVLGELGEILARGITRGIVVVVVMANRRRGEGRRPGSSRGAVGQADLRQEAFDLAQPLADLGAVIGGQVIEGE